MAKKKATPVVIPPQMGFGFEVCDAEGRSPGFLFERDDVYQALDTIQQALWVSTDVEGTGLTDASMPVALGNQEIKQGASNVVRMRTIQARVPTIRGRSGPRENFVFDLDKMGKPLIREVAHTILSRKLFIAHNAGFDLYWQRLVEGRQTMPQMVADSMLLTRLLRPELVLKRAELVQDIKHVNDVSSADEVAQAAWKSLVGGASGGSLADVVLAMFGIVVDKTFQKPTNWTGLLGFGHYNYALDDTVWADRILCELFGLDEEGDLYQAYMGLRARRSTVRLLEPQVPELVLLREHGMNINKEVGRRFVTMQRGVLAGKVNELIGLEPKLEPFRAELGDPDAGLGEDLKKALAEAFEERGVSLRRTPTTGAAQVGEKDLRACRAVQMESSRPLFNAWVAVCRAKKSSNMALEVVGFAERSEDGMLRSLLSHGPVTGRLAASEPNCFTGDTEILTSEGWVRFDALRFDHLVAQYNRGQLDFTAPLSRIYSPWEGELVHNKGTYVDLLTTPEHRCLVVNHHTGIERVVDAKDYAAQKSQHQLHAVSYTGGKGLPLTDAEICSMVAAVAHGVAPAPAATSYLGESREFGPWLFDLTREQLDLFVAELWRAWPSPARAGRDAATTACCGLTEANATWVQLAWSLSGRRARLVPPADGQGGWRVHVDRNAYSTISGDQAERVPYSGMVHCVTVPSGYIMVRRNGCVMVTGQCQQWPRDQVFRAMCMSPTKPDCETTTLRATEATQKFIAKVAGRPVAAGDDVEVHSGWLAALFAADKDVPKWPDEDKKPLAKHIESLFTHTIVASDFGALDVRVGAALCVRSQREMLALVESGTPVPGPVQPKQPVVDAIRKVARHLHDKDPVTALQRQAEIFEAEVARHEKRLEKLKQQLDDGDLARSAFFKQRSEVKEQMLVAKLGWRLAQCLALGQKRGEREYSALRDAFVADIDIHTFTGMKLVGRDPMKEFEGLSVKDRKALEKKLKAELGPRRQQGKIANLSLLYGMADAGFQEAAARGYDEHWTMQEAHDIRALWMNAYPEVELWHLWTECLQVGVVYVPEQGREKPVRTGWWMARTLAGREIVACGLNAALSYQDQSTGADILGLIMHRLRQDHPHIFDCSINQVHDELVFMWLAHLTDEYLPIVEDVMVGEANSLLMPYGVPAAVSPALGVLWIKD